MTDNEHKIEIEFLDHVAIRVADLEASALWYEKVLGLKRYQLSEKAKKRYVELNLEFNIQDHIYFDSIYTKDLDGHTVELTTIKVNEQEFYK